MLGEKKVIETKKSDARKEVLDIGTAETSGSMRTWERTLPLQFKSTVSVTWKGKESYKKGFVLFLKIIFKKNVP